MRLKIMSLFNPFQNPTALVGGMLIGALLGIGAKGTLPYLIPIGKAYISLMTLCILPIIFTAIILGLGTMLRNPLVRTKISRIFPVLCLIIFVTSSVGMVIGLASQTKLNLNTKSEIILGKMTQSVEHYTPQQQTVTPTIKIKEPTAHPALSKFLHYWIPKNIFAELGKGLSARLLLITLLIGIALGNIKNKMTGQILNAIQVIRDTFKSILNWLFCLLPFGLICIFAQVVASLHLKVFLSLLYLIVIFWIASIILLCIFNMIIWFYTKGPFYKPLQLFRKPLITTFLFDNSFIPIPQSIAALKEAGCYKEIVDLVFPIGVMINRHGQILLLTLVSIFVAHFYHGHFTLGHMLMIFLLATVVGTVSFGRGVALIPSFSIIAHTVGLPVSLGILTFTIMDPFISRFLNLITIYGNCAASMIIARSKEKKHETHS